MISRPSVRNKNNMEDEQLKAMAQVKEAVTSTIVSYPTTSKDSTSGLETNQRLDNKIGSKIISERSRPMYSDRILIRGVKETTSDQILEFFIEAKFETRVKQLAYHKDRDDVVLAFLHTPDDRTLLGCESMVPDYLHESELKVFNIPVTDSILVENIPANLSEDVVVLYFENHRSGGGAVKKVNMNAYQRTCIVHFEDYSVVNNVVDRQHFLSGKQIRVFRYLECLCLSEDAALDISVPSPVVLCATNHQRDTFINQSKVFKEKLGEKLKHNCARLERRQDGNQTFVVYNTTTGVVSNKFRRQWKEKVLRTIAQEEAGIHILRRVLDKETQYLVQRLTAVTKSDNVCISFDQGKNIVSVVGFADYVDLIIRFLESASEQQSVSDSLSIRNHSEIDVLKRLGIKDMLKEKFPKLKVILRESGDMISFVGSRNDISDAKLQVLEMILSIEVRHVRVKPGLVSVSKSDVWSNVEKKLQEKYPGKFVLRVGDNRRVKLFATEDVIGDVDADLQRLVKMEESRQIEELKHGSDELSLSSRNYFAGREDVNLPSGRASYRSETENLVVLTTQLPDDWTHMNNANIKMVLLEPTDPVYDAIATRFMREVETGVYSRRLKMTTKNIEITKIERIQNKTLYLQYMAMKIKMFGSHQNCPANLPIERDLWHGTTYAAATSITMHGFNRSYSGKANGSPWYGDGVYFAADASYSARPWFSGASTKGVGYIFLAKTLTGQFCKGHRRMRYLPAIDPINDPTLIYDSAVDNQDDPLEFVIFNDTQAYPAYIITFNAEAVNRTRITKEVYETKKSCLIQ